MPINVGCGAHANQHERTRGHGRRGILGGVVLTIPRFLPAVGMTVVAAGMTVVAVGMTVIQLIWAESW